MQIKKLYTIISLIAACIGLTVAEMESKTKQEITDESILILRGRVIAVERAKRIDDFISIYKATIVVESSLKGTPKVNPESCVSIFFRNATPDGVYAEHAPRLKKDDVCVLYITEKRGILGDQDVYWLESACRVEIVPQK